MNGRIALFAYDGFDEGEKFRLEAIASEVRMIENQATFLVGKKLAEARDIFKYKRSENGFAGWVETKTSFSRSFAYELIQVSERLGSNVSRSLDTFPQSLLVELSRPSLPSGIVEKAVEKAESGDRVTLKDVELWKAEAKRKEAEAAAARAEADRIRAEAAASARLATSAYTNLLADHEKLAEQLNARPVIEKLVERTVVVEKTVVPDGYADARAALAELEKKRLKAQLEEAAAYERRQTLQAEAIAFQEFLQKHTSAEREAPDHDKVIQELSKALIAAKSEFDMFEYPSAGHIRNRWADCAASMRIFADDIERWLDRNDYTTIDARVIEGTV